VKHLNQPGEELGDLTLSDKTYQIKAGNFNATRKMVIMK
jgi:hypothetical protein